MHTLGKVCTGLLVVLTIAAIALTARALEVRNSWLKEVETADNGRTSLTETTRRQAGRLKEKRRELEEVTTSLNNTLLTWGRGWDGVETRLTSAADGTIRASLGENQGVTARGPDGAPATVYAFRPTAEGGWVYVGEFQPTRIRENEALFQATWRLRDGETEAWQPGRWRFRESIPAAQKTRFLELYNDLTRAEHQLADERKHLQTQNEIIRKAEVNLKLRMQELVGRQDDPEDKGLAGQLLSQAETRNNVLREVDALRHEREAVLRQIGQLTAQNRQLLQQLAGTEAAVAADASGP